MKRIILAVINDIATDQRLYRMAGSLAKSGAEITLAGRILRGSPEIQGLPFRIVRFRLPVNKGFLFYGIYNIRLFFYLLLNRYDIIVSNDLDTLPACFFASVFSKSKLVFDSHELFTEVPELEGRQLVKKTWLFLERMILPRVKHAITVSDSVAKEYEKRYNIEMTVIRNLPLTRETGIPKIPELEKITNRIILYQGAVNKGRGLERLTEAMAYLKDYYLIIAGDGDIMQELKERVHNLELTKQVIFTGRLLPDELKKYTAYATIGVSLEESYSLNYYYSLPNKLFSYIHAGVPCLVSPFPEMQKIIEQYDVGKVSGAKNPEELANELSNMLKDKTAHAAWKQNCLKARKMLCWEKEEEKVFKVYNQLGLNF